MLLVEKVPTLPQVDDSIAAVPQRHKRQVVVGQAMTVVGLFSWLYSITLRTIVPDDGMPWG